MMHHATKRGFKDCPGFLNSTGRLGPKRGRKCDVAPAFSGVPNKGGQNQNSKPPLQVTMMPPGAPSISKYGSPVRPHTQIVALHAHGARTARALRLRRPLISEYAFMSRGVINAKKKSCSKTWYFEKSPRTVHAFTPVFPIVQP